MLHGPSAQLLSMINLYLIFRCLFAFYTITMISDRPNWNSITTLDLKGSLGAAVKLLPCDHEVMGSSPENSLL
jgi:hypothetical protein